MNILHIEDERWDSGLAAYALTLAAEQARRGHRVQMWGRAGSPVLDRAERAGLGVRAWSWLAGGIGSWPRLRRAAAEFAPRVIDAHTGSAHTLALVLAAGRSCAVVRTAADARPPRAHAAARFAARRTAAYLAANSVLEEALRRSFPGSPVVRVPQGVDGPGEPKPLPAEPVAGVLARLDPVKGHAALFEAAVGGPPGLVVRCAGEGRLADELAERARGSATRIELLGRVEDPWAFMAGCRIGVVPSLGSEAVSRAALEWMAAGRPVIASRVGGLPDLVEHGETGLLVPPGGAGSLRNALAELALDPERAARMGAAGRKRWEREFSPAPFYEATQRVYEQITAHLPS